MQPGSAWPGNTLSGGSSDQFAIFTGTETFTYPQYLDVRTQKTLVATPGGGEYDIAVASGYPGVGPVPDDGRWITG